MPYLNSMGILNSNGNIDNMPAFLSLPTLHSYIHDNIIAFNSPKLNQSIFCVSASSQNGCHKSTV